MVVAMDLNASPLPEDDEDNFESHVEQYSAPEGRIETGAELARREREERRKRIKIERGDDSSYASRQPADNQVYASKPQNSYDKSKLPPGWLECPSAGQEICGMVPSKVPLGEMFYEYIPIGRRYSFKQVIRQQAVSGRKSEEWRKFLKQSYGVESCVSFLTVALPEHLSDVCSEGICLYLSGLSGDGKIIWDGDLLGLVIDLTNTSRYYSTNEFKKEGIKHIKIQCRGRDAVPENMAVNQFVYEVMQFLSQQKLTKKYILVHCTHGHNRTGYMIVHFLMRTQLMSVTQAITKFSEARPPGIYKPDYIDALYAFYHEKKPENMLYPPIPEWKRSSEFDLNGEAVPDDDDDGNAAAPLHSNQETDAKLTNDDVLGDDIPSDQLIALRHTCYQMLKLTVPGRGAPQFPGSHPVSLNRENLQLLRQRYYYATWKADGTRYMMLITMDGCYLVDRSFNFRRVQMRFPCKSGSDVPFDKMHHFTLLDGEMVIDTLPDTQKQERRYLIYDLMALNHVPVVERPFSERWKMIEKEVLGPRNAERHNAHLFPYRYEMEPFRVRRKDFWLLSTVTKLLRDFIPRLSHEADGLIFQGWDDPYVPKTHNGLLKWKYPEMNSVDFLFEVNPEGRQSLCLFDRGKKKPMDGQRVEFKDDADPSSYSGKIIECSWDKHKEVWECMRVRTDKNAPNEINTYRKVMRSITDNITEAVLLGEINEIIRLPMYADRINNDSKAAARRR